MIVANHASYLDALALAAALPLRYVRRAFWGGDTVTRSSYFPDLCGVLCAG